MPDQPSRRCETLHRAARARRCLGTLRDRGVPAVRLMKVGKGTVIWVAPRSSYGRTYLCLQISPGALGSTPCPGHGIRAPLRGRGCTGTACALLCSWKWPGQQ